MASRTISPGGALLRTSRMFSIPPPLEPPPKEIKVGAVPFPDSATLPYPTHLALTTPPSARARGDWGLKRSLPLSTTTRNKSPYVRVRQFDSVEKVTDFQHASDHVITLKKFQEVGLPITIPNRRRLPGGVQVAEKSVFEDATDVTAVSDPLSSSAGSSSTSTRWAFRGPGLVGMREGEYQEYLRSTVRSRRTEFRAFLRRRLAAELSANQPPSAAPVAPSSITDAQLATYIRKLQSDRPTLHALAASFLDLPPIALGPTFSLFAEGSAAAKVVGVPVDDAVRTNPFTSSGGNPPRTHPSAGLGYLRTASRLANHPRYGPQRADALPEPVLARVLQPRQGAYGPNVPKLGVAGFVVDVPDDAEGSRFSRSAVARSAAAAARNGGSGRILARSAAIPGLALVDPRVPGGEKVYVAPRAARVDVQGRVALTVGLLSEEARLVAAEARGDIPSLDGVPAEAQGVVPQQQQQPMPQPGPAAGTFGKTRISSSSNYGLT